MITRQLTKEQHALIINNLSGESLRDLGLVMIPKDYIGTDIVIVHKKVEVQKTLGDE